MNQKPSKLWEGENSILKEKFDEATKKEIFDGFCSQKPIEEDPTLKKQINKQYNIKAMKEIANNEKNYESWEEEFDRKFGPIFTILDTMVKFFSGTEHEVVSPLKISFKSFISSLLSKAKQEGAAMALAAVRDLFDPETIEGKVAINIIDAYLKITLKEQSK